jgi:hypothetical protein
MNICILLYCTLFNAVYVVNIQMVPLTCSMACCLFRALLRFDVRCSVTVKCDLWLGRLGDEEREAGSGEIVYAA